MFPLGENLRVDRILSLEGVNSDFWDSSDLTFCNTKTIVYLGLSNSDWSLTGFLYRLWTVSDGWKLKSPRVDLCKRTHYGRDDRALAKTRPVPTIYGREISGTAGVTPNNAQCEALCSFGCLQCCLLLFTHPCCCLLLLFNSNNKNSR